jgi:hypothetical protein
LFITIVFSLKNLKNWNRLFTTFISLDVFFFENFVEKNSQSPQPREISSRMKLGRAKMQLFIHHFEETKFLLDNWCQQSRKSLLRVCQPTLAPSITPNTYIAIAFIYNVIVDKARLNNTVPGCQLS